MPSIKDQSTVEAIAVEFTSNGRCKEKAMISVGYTKAYANSYCGKMWENKRLTSAIEAIDAKTKQESIASRKVRQEFWTNMMNDSKTTNSDKLRASELLGRSEADFTDNVISNTGLSIKVKEREYPRKAAETA